MRIEAWHHTHSMVDIRRQKLPEAFSKDGFEYLLTDMAKLSNIFGL